MSAPTPAIHCQFPVANAGSSSIKPSIPFVAPDAPIDAEIEAEHTRPRLRARADASIRSRAADESRRRRADIRSHRHATRRAPGGTIPIRSRASSPAAARRCVRGLNHASCRKKSRWASARKKRRSESRCSLIANGSARRSRTARAIVRGEIVPKERCAESCDVPSSDGTLAAIAYCGGTLAKERSKTALRDRGTRCDAEVVRAELTRFGQRFARSSRSAQSAAAEDTRAK